MSSCVDPQTSEEIIYRHLIAVFHDEETKIDLGRVVPLPPYHHVHQVKVQLWEEINFRLFFLNNYVSSALLLEMADGIHSRPDIDGQIGGLRICGSRKTII